MRKMDLRRLFAMGLGALMVYPVVAGQLAGSSVASRIDAKVEDKYVDEDGSFVEILGVASITPEVIDCWDTNGVRSPSLNESVKAACSRLSSYSGLTFTFGKKTRYFITRTSRNLQGLEWRSLTEAYLGVDHLGYESRQDIRLFGVTYEPSRATETLVARFTNQNKETVLLQNKVGARAVVLSTEYEVVSSQPQKLSNPEPGQFETPQPYTGKRWMFLLKYKSQATESTMSNLLSVIGLDKQPVKYVDLKGNPVSAVTFLSDPEPENPIYIRAGSPAKLPQYKYAKAIVQWSRGVEGLRAITTNIDPSKIGAFVFSFSRGKNVQFKSIPLDPKN